MTRLQVSNYVFNSSDVLGKGSTGTVYLGYDIRNGTKVAIKAIELKTINNEVTKYLLKNEIKALQITNHPNVLHAYDVVADSNCYYVVTNYCSNQTLEDYIKKRGRIPQQEAVRIFAQIVEGYTSIRMNNILHRDLKPSNILFSESQKPVICDFGYCEIAGYLPKPKMYYNVGSPAYMAPESITKNVSSQESEIWSLGTIFYEMLQGRSFTQGRDTMEAIMQIKKVGPYVPDGVSETSKRVIAKCMELNPGDRIKLKDLLAVFRGGQPKTKRPTIADHRVSLTQSVQFIEGKNSKNMLVSEVNHIDVNNDKQQPLSPPQKHITPSILIPPSSISAQNTTPPKKSSSTTPKIKKPSIMVQPSSNVQIDDDDNKSMISKPEVFPEYFSHLQQFDEQNTNLNPHESNQPQLSDDESITSEMRDEYIQSTLFNMQKQIGVHQNHSASDSSQTRSFKGVFGSHLTVPGGMNNTVASQKSIDSNKSENQMLNSAAFLYPTVGTFAKNMAVDQQSQMMPLLKPANSNINIPTPPNIRKQVSPQKPKQPQLLMSFSKPVSEIPKQSTQVPIQQYYQSHIPLSNQGYYPQSNLNYYQPASGKAQRRY